MIINIKKIETITVKEGTSSLIISINFQTHSESLFVKGEGEGEVNPLCLEDHISRYLYSIFTSSSYPFITTLELEREIEDVMVPKILKNA